jgi:hypothetical protein
MSPPAALPGARRAASGPARGRPTASAADRLDSLSMRLDELIRDVRFVPEVRSHREVERRIAEAEDIAGELRAIFRSSASPQHAPLKRQGSGAWW